jgi:hypothetical protein
MEVVMALSPAQSTTEQFERELDKLVDRAAYTRMEAQRLLSYKTTYFYQLLNAGEFDTFWAGGRKVTGASIKAHLRRQREAAQNEPLRRGGPGRPRRMTNPTA